MAADPLQLAEALSDEDFDALVKQHKIRVHELNTCYRQKRNLGQLSGKTAAIIAKSSPFLASDKKEAYLLQHERLTELANNLVFRNPHGYVQSYRNARLADFRTELERVKNHPAGQWRHWPPLMIALIDPELIQLPAEWSRALARSGVPSVVLGPEEIANAKGVEFQHVFVTMYPELFNQLDSGFEGSGKRVYNYRRLLRIPFSRGKDSLVVFSVRRGP